MKYLLVSLFALLALSADGAIRVASPFGDHMVLQRERPAPVWGSAEPGEEITVTFAGRVVYATADADGRWRAELPPMDASAKAARLVVSGSATPVPVAFEDVVVGEVWICGGQSNMERRLGPRAQQLPITNWKAEAAAASYPQIRQLCVEQTHSLDPQESVAARWTVCSPTTVLEFSAVGYFFARDLHRELGVPIGIIHSSWGGTPAEAWTSAEGLQSLPDLDQTVRVMRELKDDPDAARRYHDKVLERWYSDNDPGSGEKGWQDPTLDTSDWKTLSLPGAWEEQGHDGFDGVAWLRTAFDLPPDCSGADLELRLGAIDDADTTWVNGVRVGATEGWQKRRAYRIPANALKAKGNIVAVRVLDLWGGGGVWNSELPVELSLAGDPSRSISLAGSWKARFSLTFEHVARPPSNIFDSQNAPTVLYNAMIAPLAPYAIRGVAFYQGEANAQRARQYRTLLPALIEDWRNRWDQGDFPFLFVQIAPFKEMPPEIREAQLQAWQETSNTAMIVTMDVGNAEDIHPADKAPVGARLALAARALAYGERVEYSGPEYASTRFEKGRAIVGFRHVGGGLLAIGGALEGFTIAGRDGRFYPANARIIGDEVEVTAREVRHPITVRYGWANVPEGNLFNRAGLPASPFRSDSQNQEPR